MIHDPQNRPDHHQNAIIWSLRHITASHQKFWSECICICKFGGGNKHMKQTALKQWINTVAF